MYIYICVCTVYGAPCQPSQTWSLSPLTNPQPPRRLLPLPTKQTNDWKRVIDYIYVKGCGCMFRPWKFCYSLPSSIFNIESTAPSALPSSPCGGNERVCANVLETLLTTQTRLVLQTATYRRQKICTQTDTHTSTPCNGVLNAEQGRIEQRS